MVNFAELKAKAEKAKDASVAKVTNTRDRYSSVPASQTVWDPNWKRVPPSATPSPRSSTSGPPPLSRSRPDVIASSGGTAPVVPRASRPADSDDLPASPLYMPRPPPTRVASGYPPGHREVASHDAVNKIDWENLSAEDKEVFFGWLDEFFSRYLGIELGPRERGPAPASSVRSVQNTRPPPTINLATRPPV